MIEQKYVLDIVPGGVPVVVHCHQNDVIARAFSFKLVSRNGMPSIPESADAFIEGQKPDGKVFSYPAILYFVAGEHFVEIDLKSQMTVLAGDVKCQCKITQADKVLICANFILRVQDDYTVDADTSDTDIPGLVQQAQAAAEAAASSTGQLSEKIGVLEARMDEFSRLPDGSTTGDAELADIRVGANGKTYQTAGDAVRGQAAVLQETIRGFNSFDVFTDTEWPEHNYNGIVAKMESGKYRISGTATADTNINLYAETNKFPANVDVGDLLTFRIEKYGTIPLLQLFFYQNGAYVETASNMDDGYQVTVPQGATGMLLRFRATAGREFLCACNIYAIKVMSNGDLYKAVPVILPSETLYKTKIIEETLAKHGAVQLVAGTYLIDDINMPDNTVIRGFGESTVLKAWQTSNGIIVGANCTIENLRITSENGHTTSQGVGSGIVVRGNHEDSPFKYHTKIINVTIDGFGYAGIQGAATGYWVANSMSVVNCKMTNCYCGIVLEDYCEFNRITNCLCYNNYIGALIYSGNNTIVNCSLSNNTVGLYLDGETAGYAGNNGHGAVIGCTINHSDNNNGYAIIARSITNGFIIEGCNIWYGKVLTDAGQETSRGIMLQNCLFGGGTPEIVNWGADALLLMGCVFKATPTFTGHKRTIKANCYLADGTPVT